MRASLAPAVLVAAAALLVATASSAAAPAGAAPPAGAAEILRSATVLGWAGSPSSRRLRVDVGHGVCSKGVRLTGMRLSPQAVRLRFAEVFTPEQAAGACPALLQVSCYTVTLPVRRGRRYVVDAASGRRVPRGVAPSPATSGARCPAAPRR